MIRTYPVIVLGMHRSGTSMLAHALIKMGVDMGSDLLQADEGNPLGYWEDKKFLHMNKRIITLAGGEWNFPANRKELFRVEKNYRKKINDLCQDRIKAHRDTYWGWKDPRNSLTAPIWHKHLSTFEPKYILIRRNRPDVLQSLLKRNQDAVNWSRLAKMYSEHISVFIRRDLPKIHVCHYEDFIYSQEKAFSELNEIAKFLGMKIPNKTVWKAVDVVRMKEKST